MPLPTTFHSMSLTSPRAATRPLVWMRPMTQPTSPSLSARSWPALPGRDADAAPWQRQGESIQRLTALESSWAWPLVPRLTLIETERQSSPQLLGQGEQVVDRVGDPGRVVERAPALRVGLGERDRTAAIVASRQTPRLPAAMLATCVPCEPGADLRLRLELVPAARPALGAAAIASSRSSLRNSAPKLKGS